MADAGEQAADFAVAAFVENHLEYCGLFPPAFDPNVLHVRESFGDEERRAQLKESTNIFRVLIKTLLHAGIITSRTAPLYAVWVDMDELKAEGDGIPGDIVADEMLVVLRQINARRRRIGAKDVSAAAG